MNKVLLFAPYGSWTVHHQLDAVVGAALMRRGCTVRAFCCDGIFKQCPLVGDRPAASTCRNCFESATTLFSRFQIPLIKLGSLSSQEDRTAIAAWAADLPRDEIAQATFDGLPLWDWVSVGILSRLRSASIDFTPKNEQLCRDSLYNAALLARILTKFLRIYKPNQVICYNGGHPYYRVAYQLARAREANVLVHERGHREDTFLLLNNRSNHFVTSEFEEWPAWRDAPLSPAQLRETLAMRDARETGTDSNFISFRNWSQDVDAIRWRLRIPADARVLTLFATGNWEYGMAVACGLQAIFDSQREWIQRTAEFCAREGIYLVVRHHPLGAGTKTYPRDSEFIREVLVFNRTLGPHVRVIMPAEKISSYDLIWNSDAAVVAYSTISWESILRGLWTTCVAESIFTGLGMDRATSQDAYEEHLRNALERTEHYGLDEMRYISRLVHFLYFVVLAHHFKSFGIRDVYSPDIRIASLEDLAPGHDPMLDRVCEHIMHRSPLYEMPEALASAEQETELLEQEVRSIRQHRAAVRRAAASLSASRQEPQVAVIALGVAEGQEAGILETSVAHARHRQVTLHRLALAGTGSRALVAALRTAATSVQGDFIHFASASLQVDEAAYAAAVDALLEAKHKDAPGATFGVYWCPDGACLREELFTAVQPASDFREAIQRIPPLMHPIHLLAAGLWRREAFCAFWENVPSETLLALSMAIYHQLFGPDNTYHHLEIPMVTLYAK